MLELTDLQRFLVKAQSEILQQLDVIRLRGQPYTPEFAAIDDMTRNMLHLCAEANDIINRSAQVPKELPEDRPLG